MPKRVCHSIRHSWVLSNPDKSGNYRVDEEMWCGRLHQLIRNDIEELSEKEKLEFEKFKIEQKINPWPLCKKCEKEKAKSKSYQFKSDGKTLDV